MLGYSFFLLTYKNHTYLIPSMVARAYNPSIHSFRSLRQED